MEFKSTLKKRKQSKYMHPFSKTKLASILVNSEIIDGIIIIISL